MSVLTVAISTVKNERDNVINRIKLLDPSFKEKVDFLIVSQYEDVTADECTTDIDYCLIKSNTKGLSKSRNIAIRKVKTQWVWFQDDDFCFNESEFDSLIESILIDVYDIILIRIGSFENRSEYYKKYPSYKKFTRLLSLKVSSIEIVARVNFIREKDISFDENLGLGTSLPCCEENKFMLDSFDNGANVYFLKKTLCYHTTLVESRRIDYAKNLRAKGFFLKSLPVYISLPLILKWSFSIKSDLGFLQNLKLLCQGLLLKEVGK